MDKETASTDAAPSSMNIEATFQRLVKEALAKHGSNTWGQKHSLYVIAGLFADENGADVADMLETDAVKYSARVVNPSAFAQWLDKHVKGFTREKQSQKLATKFASFEV